MNISSPILSSNSPLRVLPPLGPSGSIIRLRSSLHQDKSTPSQLGSSHTHSSPSLLRGSLLTHSSSVSDILFPSVLTSESIESCGSQIQMMTHGNHDSSTSIIGSPRPTYEQGLLRNNNEELCGLHQSGTTPLQNDVSLLHHSHTSLHSHHNQQKFHSNSNGASAENNLHGRTSTQLPRSCSSEKYGMELCNSLTSSSCDDTGLSTSCEPFCGGSTADPSNPSEMNSPHHSFPSETNTSDVGISLPHNHMGIGCLPRNDMSKLHTRQPSSSSTHMDMQALSAPQPVIIEDVTHTSDVLNPVSHFRNDGMSHHHRMHNHLRTEATNRQENASESGAHNKNMSNLILHHCHAREGGSTLNANKHQGSLIDQHVSSALPSNFVVKNEIDYEMLQCITSSSSLNSAFVAAPKHSSEPSCSGSSMSSLLQPRNSSTNTSNLPASMQHDLNNVVLQQHLAHHSAVNHSGVNPSSQTTLHQGLPQHIQHISPTASVSHHQLMNQHPAMHHSHHLEQQCQQHMFAAAAAATTAVPRHHHLHYNNALVPASNSVSTADCLTTQKAVAFLAGPRERIHVIGNPVDQCPRCLQEGNTSSAWRPHRHIGELKIRYICSRLKNDLESNHHIDVPLCPVCNQVLYIFEFNSMLGVSNARRLHKYVLKCASRHVLPLLDLFCQTKKGGGRCNANFKLQWCYGTMVKRCEAQKNRDHDLWWVRYKNEWKQRRTIIRYKKDFLSHLTDAQRSLLLGLGLEGEPPPDPKSTLGPTFDALVSSLNGGSLNGPKIKKRAIERGTDCLSSAKMLGVLDTYDLLMNSVSQRRYRGLEPNQTRVDYASGSQTAEALNEYGNHHAQQQQSASQALHRLEQHSHRRLGNLNTLGTGEENNSHQSDIHHDESVSDNGLRHVMGAVVLPSSSRTTDETNSQLLLYLTQQQENTNQRQPGTRSTMERDYSPGSQTNFGSFMNGAGNFLSPNNNLSDNVSGLRHNSGVGLPGSWSAESGNLHSIPSHMIITGTPTPPLPAVANGRSVAIAVVGDPVSSTVITTL